MVIVQITTDNREHFREYHKKAPWFGTAPEALLRGFAQLPDVKVHVVTCTQQPMAASPEKLANNIWFHSLHVPKLGWMRTGYHGCVRALRQKLREIQPEIVHGQGTERDCALSAISSGYPNVLTVHGNMRVHACRPENRKSIYHKLAAILEKFCLKRTNGVIAITNYTANLVKGLNSKIWILPNAIESRFFDIELNSPPVPRFLFVGSLDQRKNPLGLVNACAPYLEAGSCSLALAGQFEPQTHYGKVFQTAANALPNIEFLGFIGRDELAKEFAKSSALILPTFEDNCPMVVLEAMAAGLPVAASRVGGVPDLVTHQKTGLLFNPENLDNIRFCIEFLISNPEFRISAGQAGKRKALEKFHPLRIAKRHTEIYQEVLGKNQPSC